MTARILAFPIVPAPRLVPAHAAERRSVRPFQRLARLDREMLLRLGIGPLRSVENLMSDEQGAMALVVDDNHMIMLHASEILEDAGFRTLTAFTGEEAQKALEVYGDQISLLFTDVQMPPGRIDGFELARWTAQRWPSIGILVASGERTPKSGELPEGAHFVAKPFSAEVIYERLQELLPHDRKPTPLRDRG